MTRDTVIRSVPVSTAEDEHVLPKATSYYPLPSYAIKEMSGKGGESPMAKLLIGGGVTVLLEMSGGHFLEFLKIAKQTSTESYATIFRNVTVKKGLVGTLDGFLPWGVIQAAAKGSVFSFGQAASLNQLVRAGVDRDSAMVLSGGVGGAVQGVAMSPLLLLKTRVMTDPSFRGSGGLVETALASAAVGGRIIRTEGATGLFKGVTLFSLKRALDWTSRYLFVVMTEHFWLQRTRRAKLTEGEEVVASLLGGTFSALSTIPLDVLVAAKQSAGAAGKRVGFFSTLADKVAKEGVGELLRYSTKGLGARVVHVAVTTLAMKKVTTWVYDFLYSPPLTPRA